MTVTAPSPFIASGGDATMPIELLHRTMGKCPLTQAPLWPPTTQAHTIGLQSTLSPHLFIHSVVVHEFVSIAPSYDRVSTTSLDPILMPTMLSSPNPIATSLGRLLEHLSGPHPSPLLAPLQEVVVSPLVPPLQVLPTVVHTDVPPAWLPAPATQLPDNFFYTTTNIATTYRQVNSLQQQSTSLTTLFTMAALWTHPQRWCYAATIIPTQC